MLVLGLTLDQFMGCFWDNQAPYLIPALLRNEEDEIVNYSNWTEPDETDRELFGQDVISVMKVQKKIHTTPQMRLYTAPDVVQHIALIERSDLAVTIMVRQSQSGSPYATKHQEWFKWEFMTPDTRSFRTGVR